MRIETPTRACSYDLFRLQNAIAPVRLRWIPRLRSTSDYAARLRRGGRLFAPSVVLTGRQSAGRGRGLNRWWSNHGCITMTLVLAAHEHLSVTHVPLVAGWALRNVLAELAQEPRIELKWPNDLLYGGRKLAGLLCERVRGADLIGVGVNVNLDAREVPEPLRRRVTSLSSIAGHRFDKTDVLVCLVRRLHHVLSRRDEYPFGSILREFDEYHCLRGKEVRVSFGRSRGPILGTCQGLDSSGRLVVRRCTDKLRIVSGQVQVRQTR